MSCYVITGRQLQLIILTNEVKIKKNRRGNKGNIKRKEIERKKERNIDG
jgi:hypothetical protein